LFPVWPLWPSRTGHCAVLHPAGVVVSAEVAQRGIDLGEGREVVRRRIPSAALNAAGNAVFGAFCTGKHAVAHLVCGQCAPRLGSGVEFIAA